MYKILVVEDNADLSIILSELLARHFDVTTALTGEDAVALAPGLQPDAVILDLHLPGISGIETGLAIKSLLAPRQIPILALTALAGTQEEAAVLSSGCCDAYMAKPAPLAVIKRKIEELLHAVGVG